MKKYLVSPSQSQLQTAMQMQAMQQQSAMQQSYYSPGQQYLPPPPQVHAVPPYQQVQQPSAIMTASPPNSQQQPPQPPPPQAQTLPRLPQVYQQPPPQPPPPQAQPPPAQPQPPNSQQQPPLPQPPQAQTLPRPPQVYQQSPPPQAQTLPRLPHLYQQPPPPQVQTLAQPPYVQQPPLPQVRPSHLLQQQQSTTVVMATGATQVQVRQESRQSMNFTDNPTHPRRVQYQRSHANQHTYAHIKEEVYRRMPNTRQVWIKDVYADTVNDILQGIKKHQKGNFEKPVDRCCITWLCGSSGPEKHQLKANAQIAQSSGEKVIKDAIRATYKTIKEILIYFQFLFALATLILSVICLFENNWSVAMGENVFEIIAFALSAVTFVYTSIDAATQFFTYTIYCKTCFIWRDTCCSKNSESKESKNSNPKESQNSKSKDSNKSSAESEESSCKENCETILDIVRLLITECCFYLLLLLSIFQLIRAYVDRNIDDISGVDWALFGIGMVQDLGPVYLCRVIVLAGSVRSIHKVRNAERKSEDKSLFFYVLFVIQAYSQLLIQIMMIFTISATYYHQYNDCTNHNHSLNECYIPSGQFVYMVVFGLVNPLVGTIMFLMVCRYWAQNFSIKLILGMTKKIFKSGGADDAWGGKKYAAEVDSIILEEFNSKAGNDYEQFSNISLLSKLLYPFGNPLRIFLSMAYTGALVAFGLFANFALSGLRSSVPDWLYHFYIAEAIFVFIVNCYVMTIAFVWAFIIMVAIFVCIICVCTQSSNNNNNGR